MTTRGSYVHKPVLNFSGASWKCVFMQFSQNIDGFRQEQFSRLLKLIKLYKQNPLEIFFLRLFFTIYQNYTLALTSEVSF